MLSSFRCRSLIQRFCTDRLCDPFPPFPPFSPFASVAPPFERFEVCLCSLKMIMVHPYPPPRRLLITDATFPASSGPSVTGPTTDPTTGTSASRAGGDKDRSRNYSLNPSSTRLAPKTTCKYTIKTRKGAKGAKTQRDSRATFLVSAGRWRPSTFSASTTVSRRRR